MVGASPQLEYVFSTKKIKYASVYNIFFWHKKTLIAN